MIRVLLSNLIVFLLVPSLHAQTEDFGLLIDALKDKSNRKGASIALVQKGKSSIPHLKKLLTTDDPDLLVWAVFTLGELGSHAKPVIKDLAKLRANPSRDVRATVAEALGKIESDTAFEALILLLKDRDDNVRLKAVKAFASFKELPESLIRLLVSQLNDPVLRTSIRDLLATREKHLRCLAELYLVTDHKFDVQVSLMRMEPKKFTFPFFQETTRQVYAKVLADPQRSTQDKSLAAEGLTSCGKPGYQELINAFADEALTRIASSQFIHADQSAIPQLLKALEDENLLVRAAAADALSHFGKQAKSIVGPLIQRLADDDRNVRYRVVRCLHEFGVAATPAIRDLAQVILNPREQEPTRQWAIKTLIVTLPGTHDQVVKALIEASGEKQNYGVSSLAKQQLKKIDAKAAEAAGIR